MLSVHGIIFAYYSASGLRDLTAKRTSASLPFCARYRLIDFMLSNMVNAGIRNVGVIMQSDYQSLLDHIGSGKDWELSRSSGGIRLLPPFGYSGTQPGTYRGTMHALSSISTYLERVKEEYVILAKGDTLANIDIAAALNQHVSSGAEITAVCTSRAQSGLHERFVPGADDFSSELHCSRFGDGPGLASMMVYILSTKKLRELCDYCEAGDRVHFHRDALTHYINMGGRVNIYMHRGYMAQFDTVRDYYSVSMDMLRPDIRADIFPEGLPIRTKNRTEVSTYYGPRARSVNSLVADGCIVEGEIENCILFRGVRVGRGARLRNCIIMQDGIIRDGAELSYAIADKDVTVSRGIRIAGTESVQLLIPKGSTV